MKQSVMLAGVVLVQMIWGQELAAQGDWHWQHPLPQGNSLNDVAFATSDTAVAVGDFGTMLRTTDGGTTWVTLDSPTRVELTGVAFADALHGIAVGQYGTARPQTVARIGRCCHKAIRARFPESRLRIR
ncbi:MAG: hypothetical protein IPP94_11575 [Ignavibacteria bacterium]|nr:hypothetical protein [Ignavibacteria bacterium]